MSAPTLSQRLHSAILNELGYGMAFDQLQPETQALLREVAALEARARGDKDGVKDRLEKLIDYAHATHCHRDYIQGIIDASAVFGIFIDTNRLFLTKRGVDALKDSVGVVGEATEV